MAFRIDENKQLLAAALALAIAAGLFYWYEVRPSGIRVACSEQAERAAVASFDTKRGQSGFPKDAPAGSRYPQERDSYYVQCLQSRGLAE